MPASATQQVISGLRAFTAVGSAALVLVLTVLASSPQAHEHVHEDAAQSEHACAVVLYAHGCEADFSAVVVTVSAQAFCELVAKKTTELFLVEPHYRLQPERGPPGC